MVNFKDGEIRHIVPYNLLTPEVQALSYSLGEAMRRLQYFSAGVSLYASIEAVPESVLDLMALELNTQYYDQKFPRHVKERLVSMTLAWYLRAGTPSVMEEFLGTVLAGGYLEEWYTYGGKPYFFKAYARVREEDEVPHGYAKEIIQRIEIYKNVRSWLESFAFILGVSFDIGIDYGAKLEMISAFFPRGNYKLLMLDGEWCLDGEYLLDGFMGPGVEFYPARLWISGYVRTQVLLGGNSVASFRMGVVSDKDLSGALELISVFFPRANCAYLLLDGKYRLNGFTGSKMEFCPVRMKASGSAGPPAPLGAEGAVLLCLDVKSRMDEDASLHAAWDYAIPMELQAVVRVFGDIGVKPEAGGIQLLVEHDLWQLDGMYLLDGSKLLDAEISEYSI